MKQLAEKFSDEEIKEAMEKLKNDPRNEVEINIEQMVRKCWGEAKRGEKRKHSILFFGDKSEKIEVKLRFAICLRYLSSLFASLHAFSFATWYKHYCNPAR